jgi:hypothetical protein
MHRSGTRTCADIARDPPRVSERGVSSAKAYACTAQCDAHVDRYADTIDGDTDADRDANSPNPGPYAAHGHAPAGNPYGVRSRV